MSPLKCERCVITATSVPPASRYARSSDPFPPPPSLRSADPLSLPPRQNAPLAAEPTGLGAAPARPSSAGAGAAAAEVVAAADGDVSPTRCAKCSERREYPSV